MYEVDRLRSLKEIDAAVVRVLDDLEVAVPDAKARVRAWLDGLAVRVRVQTRSFVAAGYVTEQSAERFATSLAEEVSGLRIDLLRARSNLHRSMATFGGLPAEVQGAAIDFEAERLRASEWHRTFAVGEPRSVRPGVWRYTCLPPVDEQKLNEDEIVVVSAQNEALLERCLPGALVPDGAWGRPLFEWAYDAMEAVHRSKTGEAGRLLWVWADPWLVSSAMESSHATTQGRSALAGLAHAADHRLLVARLPRSSVTLSSYFLWDGFVLRGRYVPRSIEDARDFHGRHGKLLLGTGDWRDEPPHLVDEILNSWRDRVFAPESYTGSELKLQATVARIEPAAILAVLKPTDIDPSWPQSSSVGTDDADLTPRRLIAP